MLNQIPCSSFWKFSIPVKFLHSSRQSLNHYDTLKLPRNCTTKDIKDSYIKLSKENHPDLNKNPSAHKQFLKVKEAYNVLCKTDSRRNYDYKLSYMEKQRNNPHYNSDRYEYDEAKNPWSDSGFYTDRDKSKDAFYSSKPYYGIDGLSRVSNSVIAVVCVILTTIAFGCQFLLIRAAFETIASEEYKRKKAVIWSKRENSFDLYRVPDKPD